MRERRIRWRRMDAERRLRGAAVRKCSVAVTGLRQRSRKLPSRNDLAARGIEPLMERGRKTIFRLAGSQTGRDRRDWCCWYQHGEAARSRSRPEPDPRLVLYDQGVENELPDPA